jgi:hypothetical protein
VLGCGCSRRRDVSCLPGTIASGRSHSSPCAITHRELRICTQPDEKHQQEAGSAAAHRLRGRHDGTMPRRGHPGARYQLHSAVRPRLSGRRSCSCQGPSPGWASISVKPTSRKGVPGRCQPQRKHEKALTDAERSQRTHRASSRGELVACYSIISNNSAAMKPLRHHAIHPAIAPSRVMCEVKFTRRDG